MGVTVEMLWSALIEQAYASSVSGVVQILMGFLIITILWYKARTVDDEELSMVLCAISFIFTLIGLVSLLNFIPSVITGFVNPEYWAAKELARMIK